MHPRGFKISTLIYCFNASDQILLMNRNRPPNQGLWSPPGGKLHQDIGESPHACAAREAREELGIKAHSQDFRLSGIVSEKGYEGEHHWMMFLFEYTQKLHKLPTNHPEGNFEFFSPNQVDQLEIPKTDKTFIWPLFQKHRRGFFAVECNCQPDGSFTWQTLQSSLNNT